MIQGVEEKILQQILRFADLKRFNEDAASQLGGDDFWTLVDDAGDELYENRVKGTDMSTLDTNLLNANIGVHARQWISLHDQYANRDLGLTNGLIGLLSTYGWKAPEQFGQVYFEALSRRLPAATVAAGEANILADVTMNTSGVNTSEVFAALDRTIFSDAPLKIKKTAAIQVDVITVKIKVKTYLKETTPIEIDGIIIPSGMIVGASVNVGTVIPNDLDIGDTLIAPAATTQQDLLDKGYVDGGYIIITEVLSGQKTPQFIKLKTAAGQGVFDNTGAGELKFDTGFAIRHDYTAAARVYPCFSEVVDIERTAGSEGTQVNIIPIEGFDLTPLP